jgi:glutathione synthase/RimK-type ligase-like ATP-grasp enzyme
MRIALVTAIAAFALDEDLPPLQRALQAAGFDAPIVAWDDDTVSWARFDAALLRSPWDYTTRLAGFLAWAERTSRVTQLLNPLEVVRANTDKHYLGLLAQQGLAVVPSRFVEPSDAAAPALEAFLAAHAEAADFVVKPCVGAGSRDAQRYSRAQQPAALQHVQRLQAQQRSVLLQPYLDRVDDAGETALMFFDGEFSHAIRKGPLLQRDEGPTRALFAPERIAARVPGEDELALARAVLDSLPGGPLAYARVDLIRAADGSPCLLELELTEPSLFFAFGDGAADRFVAALARRLGVRQPEPVFAARDAAMAGAP